eukprot:jgi/Mesen1/9399/ME000614S08657
MQAKMNAEGSHILCGSSFSAALLWQVDKPEAEPVRLMGHDAEVSAVDW